MRLKLHVEIGPLGEHKGVVHTTLEPPIGVNMLIDMDRLGDAGNIRFVIMKELDVALLCLMNGWDMDTARAMVSHATEDILAHVTPGHA